MMELITVGKTFVRHTPTREIGVVTGTLSHYLIVSLCYKGILAWFSIGDCEIIPPPYVSGGLIGQLVHADRFGKGVVLDEIEYRKGQYLTLLRMDGYTFALPAPYLTFIGVVA